MTVVSVVFGVFSELPIHSKRCHGTRGKQRRSVFDNISGAPGVTQSRSGHRQPSSRLCAPSCVRGGRLRAPQHRLGRRDTASQGRKETGSKARQLVDRRAGASSLAGARLRAGGGQTGSGGSWAAARLRTSAPRARGVDCWPLQQREGHWAIVDLRRKGGHVRTVPVPDWVHGLVDDWTTAAGINAGSLFRRVSSAGNVWGEAVTEKLVWHVVKEFAAKIGVGKLAPHDLRRSCARLCRAAGRRTGADAISSWARFRADDRALPRLQRISSAVNDRIGIEPKA